MGNCINKPQFPHLHKIKDLMCCNEEHINVAVPIENIACEAYNKGGLKLTTNQALTTSSNVLEAGCKAPPIPVRIDNDDDIKPVDLCKLRKAIVVVDREQLELLLRNSKLFGSKGIAVRFSDSFKFDEHIPRWRPALPTIPEAHKY